ncbi:MFS transporter [Pigmentiphaga litoralis]|jgi:tripartite-type tricarboxylate transporter receptor subunit TctC|uniref:Bug family tripartite tricarboxylate transporter substrate binding protein n=1 Tax=Pigmentiphaga litoralis TaxID=516702 RepID=UPI001672649A|nr:tripartite tricarboxylate transporter substrate binding protein [Pigmentiphaga litoralis]GGX13086.1 MFS transporter [Pigmentiphaga litoralis]
MTRSNRRTFVRHTVVLAGAAALAHAGFATAQSYPTRPVTIVVPHAPGGAVDSVARIFAEKLKDELKQSVIVENRAGASGMIGAQHVARSEADGYTLYVNASIHSINPLLYKKSIKFDAVKDFTAVSMLTQGALIFSVPPSVGATSVSDLIAKFKASPNRYSFATSGFGSAGHLGAAQFLYENDLSQIPIVLYKGAAPALQDLVGGQVQAMMDPMLSSLPFVKAGKLTALAVTGAQRSPLLPDVPTLRESGMKDFELYSWYGLWAPANVPPAIVKQLDDASSRIMAQPDMKSKLETFGFESAYKNSANFAKFIDAETARYKVVIEKANITVD